MRDRGCHTITEHVVIDDTANVDHSTVSSVQYSMVLYASHKLPFEGFLPFFSGHMISKKKSWAVLAGRSVVTPSAHGGTSCPALSALNESRAKVIRLCTFPRILVTFTL